MSRWEWGCSKARRGGTRPETRISADLHQTASTRATTTEAPNDANRTDHFPTHALFAPRALLRFPHLSFVLFCVFCGYLFLTVSAVSSSETLPQKPRHDCGSVSPLWPKPVPGLRSDARVSRFPLKAESCSASRRRSCGVPAAGRASWSGRGCKSGFLSPPG